ncbi:MAG: archaemetzincin family Zn-dependent metalloprotease [Bacteroidales bacterium]
MKAGNIVLISFGYFEQELLEKLAGDVKEIFSLPVNLKDGMLDLSEFYDPARRQYNGTTLLKRIEEGFSLDDSRTLGLFSVDLFIPILTYIFGQAYLNGRSGIVSTYRLNNERYGMAKDDNLLMERMRKEIIHELGHMFGLIHCRESSCVMRSSTYVEEIDMKDYKLCRNCAGQLSASRTFS